MYTLYYIPQESPLHNLLHYFLALPHIPAISVVMPLSALLSFAKTELSKKEIRLLVMDDYTLAQG